MVNFKAGAVFLTFASSVFAATMPRALTTSTDAKVDGLVARDVEVDTTSPMHLAIRQADFANQISNALNAGAAKCQPHCNNIKNVCKTGKSAAAITAVVKVELQAIISILVDLLATLKVIINANVGVVIDANLCIAALKVFISVLLQICVAISGCAYVSAVVSACVSVLSGCCTAFLNIILSLQICLSGLVLLLIQICLDLGLTLKLLLTLRLDCLIKVLIGGLL